MSDEQKEPRYYTTPIAMKMAEDVGLPCTLPTFHSWLEKNDLGRQPGGPGTNWFVFADKFDAFLAGKQEKKNGQNHNTK